MPADTSIPGDMGMAGGSSAPEMVTTTEDLGLEQLAESGAYMVAIGNSRRLSWVGDDFRDSERGAAVVYASTAGAAWNEVLSATGVSFTSLAAGNGHFAVLGRRDDPPIEGGLLFVSEDTQTWMGATLPNPWVETIVFGNGAFLASDRQGEGHVYVSSDARAWQESSTQSFKTLDFGAGRFVGTNGKSVAVSSDGSQWSYVGYSGNPIEDVATVGDQFVAVTSYDCCVGERGYTYQLVTSADGSTWTQQAIEGDAPVAVWSVVAGCIGVTLSSASLRLVSGATCKTADYSLSSAGSALVLQDRVFGIHTDDRLATTIVTSADAVRWTTLLK